MKVNAKKMTLIARNALAALVMTGATWIVISQPAAATQQFATQTGQSCAACHQNPKGGGALTPTGEKFKANGNKMPAKTDASTAPK
jgi:mono/diheme cytochrome c family protein